MLLLGLTGCFGYGAQQQQAATGSQAQAQTVSWTSYLTLLIPVVFIVLMWLFLIRPQRKKEKKAKEMLKSLTVGDEVVTISGVVGRIVQVKDDGFVIESGVDRTKFRVKRWAVQEKIVHESN
ncbi:MAG: preprotein translocase subunit YajC [Clostridia bacterium]|nr:preprotein translocase subunit YajC [Clostridia bacterium]MBR4439290.1 preprotein translocase subunit YajC [Clostridia bacterium]MBR5769065.1 preprotein translocase subunit YajC [Clostridia bacterium]